MTSPANEPPRVVEFIGTPPFRIVCLPSGPVVELDEGKDSLGETRWVKALLVPDRRGLGEPVYEGWTEISEALGVHVKTAMHYARLKVRPLPVRHGIRGPYILRNLLRAWVTDRSFAACKASKKSGRRPAKDG